MPTFINGQEVDNMTVNGETVLEVTLNGNRVFVDAVEMVIDNPSTVGQFRSDSDIMSDIASSFSAMDSIASSRSALQSVANSRTATDEVYENGTAINRLEDSPLREDNRRLHDRCGGADVFFRNNRVILLAHQPRGGGSKGFPEDSNRENITKFGRSSNDFPQTANKVRQFAEENNGRNGNRFSNISFIDV